MQSNSYGPEIEYQQNIVIGLLDKAMDDDLDFCKSKYYPQLVEEEQKLDRLLNQWMKLQLLKSLTQ